MINNKNILNIAHSTIFIILILITIPSLQFVSPLLYILFSTVFYVCQMYALQSIYKFGHGYFNYIFSNLLFLGFPLKFSLHTIIKHDYVEPIGSFHFSSQNLSEVITVSIVGALGIISSQYLSNSFLKNTASFKIKFPKLLNFTKKRWTLSLFAVSLLCFVINQKFNILLFGFRPSIHLPIKGNAIFFNIFTRGLIFLFLLKSFNRKRLTQSIILGTLLTMLSSIGVYSRMTIIIYLLTIFLYLLFNVSIYKKPRSYLSFILIFLISSIITVKFSTQLRNHKAKKVSLATSLIDIASSIEDLLSVAQASPKSTNNLCDQEINQCSSLIKSSSTSEYSTLLATYSNLVFERWIGMEGVMAVQSFPNKNLLFLGNAFLENKYEGNSLYTKVSSPEIYESYNESSQSISTSVPGPIAFFYYSNSYLIVYILMLISTFICTSISQLIYRINNNQIVTIFTAVFISFDFFQLGIAPRTLIYNWGFTLTYFIFFCLSHSHNENDPIYF